MSRQRIAAEKIEAANITFGRRWSSGGRWRTPVRFEIGRVWLRACVVEDEKGAVLMWPAQRARGGSWLKLAGCNDIADRDEVERSILEAYTARPKEGPAVTETRVRETFLSRRQFYARVASNEDPEALLAQLGPRMKIRCAELWADLVTGKMPAVAPRDSLLYAIVMRQIFAESTGRGVVPRATQGE